MTISVEASVLSNCRIESQNRFVSVNRIESNYFSLNRNALAVMPCGWEGNHRSGIALATRHRHLWYYHLRAQGLGEREHPPTYCGAEHGKLRLYFIFYTDNRHSCLRLSAPRAGSGVVRMDPFRLLAGCRTRRLNQA